MKILVTGGAGFIASHLVDHLITDGHQVVVVDNLSAGRRENLNPKAVFYEVDICNAGALEEVFKKEKPDMIDHHAAHVNVRKSVEMPVYDATINILGSLNLCELSRKYQVKKVVYISTGGAVYGEPKNLPVPETCTVDPLCQYGVSKHTVEHYLAIFHRLYGMNFTVLRYPNVYGPRQSPHGEAGVIAIFSELIIQNKRPTIFGDGSKTRDYVFVSDVVDANVIVLNDKIGTGEIYNLGWGKEITDLEVFQTVRKALSSRVEPIFDQKRPGEIDHISLDSSKATRVLGWRPKVPFEEGVKLSVAYYQKLMKP